MKTMTISLLFVAALASILFVAIWSLSGSIGDAKGGAAFAVAALPSISSWLEQMEAKRSSVPGAKMAIRSFEGFSLSFPATVALGAIVGTAVIELTGLFVGLIAGAIESVVQVADEAEGELFRTAAIGSLPITFVGFYLLGRWLGARSQKNGAIAVLVAMLITAIATRLIDLFLLPSEKWKMLFNKDADMTGFLQLVGMQLVLIAMLAFLGFWRGRRMRVSKYMGYLLSALPEDTRESLLDLAYEEVKQRVEARRAAPPLITIKATA